LKEGITMVHQYGKMATEDKAAAVNESGCSAISERLRIALRDLQPEAKEVFYCG